MTNLSQAKEIDLHNFRLLEAELKVCDSIEEAWCEGLEALLFIHGEVGWKKSRLRRWKTVKAPSSFRATRSYYLKQRPAVRWMSHPPSEKRLSPRDRGT